MLALLLLALAGTTYALRNSLAPWTFWLAGLTWLALIVLVLLPAALFVLSALLHF